MGRHGTAAHRPPPADLDLSGVTIRPARPADADGMGRVHVEAWQQGYDGLLPADYLASLTVAGSQRTWLETLTAGRDGSLSLVAAGADGEILAICAVGAAREPAAPTGLGELQMINVGPRWWGTGVAPLLLRHAEDELRAMTFTRAYLWVLEGNQRAERFYRRCGWQETEVHRSDPRITGYPEEIRYVREW